MSIYGSIYMFQCERLTLRNAHSLLLILLSDADYPQWILRTYPRPLVVPRSHPKCKSSFTTILICTLEVKMVFTPSEATIWNSSGFTDYPKTRYILCVISTSQQFEGHTKQHRVVLGVQRDLFLCKRLSPSRGIAGRQVD